MPCDSVTTQSINLAKALPDVLRKGLEADGWTIIDASATTITAYRSITGERVTWTAGQGIETRGNAKTPSHVTRAYSKAAVTWAAQRAGWTVKNETNGKVTLERR